jgi:hypothetical protein
MGRRLEFKIEAKRNLFLNFSKIRTSILLTPPPPPLPMSEFVLIFQGYSIWIFQGYHARVSGLKLGMSRLIGK